MHTPEERLRSLAEDPTTPYWLARLIPELLEKDPVDAANGLRVAAGLFALRSAWILHGYSRERILRGRNSADVIQLMHNEEGTDGVCLWQGQAGNGGAEADYFGDPIVQGAWYIVDQLSEEYRVIVSGPLYPLSDAAEAGATYIRAKQEGHRQLDVERLRETGEVAR